MRTRVYGLCGGAGCDVSASPYAAAVTHPKLEVDDVLRLAAEGWNDCQIARATGINRHTVLDWRHGRVPGARRTVLSRRSGCPRCDGSPLDEAAYAYLLGLYLGDGCLSRHPRAYRIRIVQDVRYSQLIELARQAISRVRGGHGKVGIVRAKAASRSPTTGSTGRACSRGMVEGIRHRNSNPAPSQWHGGPDVAALDTFIGPKA